MCLRFFNIVFMGVASLAIYAQSPKPASAPVASPPASASTATPVGPPTEDELLVIKPTPYKPALTRDPFSAPSDVENASRGDLIDDIAVKGRIVTNGKVLAVVSDSRGNVRWLPAGYKFRDGELFEISETAVVFHQRDVGSTTGTYRTVVKPFKREGGK
jgi:hypothetical protein